MSRIDRIEADIEITKANIAITMADIKVTMAKIAAAEDEKDFTRRDRLEGILYGQHNALTEQLKVMNLLLASQGKFPPSVSSHCSFKSYVTNICNSFDD